MVRWFRHFPLLGNGVVLYPLTGKHRASMENVLLSREYFTLMAENVGLESQLSTRKISETFFCFQHIFKHSALVRL